MDAPALARCDVSVSVHTLTAIFDTSVRAVCLCSYNKDMELEDAINTAILTLKEGFEGAITEENIEIAVVGVDKKFRVLSDQEVRDYVKEVSGRERERQQEMSGVGKARRANLTSFICSVLCTLFHFHRSSKNRSHRKHPCRADRCMHTTFVHIIHAASKQQLTSPTNKQCFKSFNSLFSSADRGTCGQPAGGYTKNLRHLNACRYCMERVTLANNA